MNNDNDAAIIDVELDIKYEKQALDQLKQEFMKVRDQSNKIFEETGEDFAKSIAGKGGKAITELESKIRDITKEMSKITQISPSAGSLQTEKEMYVVQKNIDELNKENNQLNQRRKQIKAEEYEQTKLIEQKEKELLDIEAKRAAEIQKVMDNEKKNSAQKDKEARQLETFYNIQKGNAQQSIENAKNNIALMEQEKSAMSAKQSANFREIQSENQVKASLQERLDFYERIKQDKEYANKLEGQTVEKLQEQNEKLREITDSYQAEIDKVKDANVEALRRVEAEKEVAEAIERQKIQLQQDIAINKEKLADLRRQKAEIKEQAARYYYLLRALKMAKYGADMMYKAMDRFQKKSIEGAAKIGKLYLKLAGSFLTFGKVIGKAVKGMTSFRKETSRSTRAHDGFLDSLKRGIWTVIKYTFGIRSLYFLFRKLRAALSEGMENLATQFPHVNEQMSSLISSFLRMKNAVAAAVQPLLNVLVPALEKLSEVFSKAAYYVGSFFAALTGQDFVYYAKKVKKSYIEDEKAAKAKKDLNDEMDRQLSSLDKLNVLTTPKNKKDDDDSTDGGVVDMFDTKPLENKFKDLIDKIKKFLKPITDAWAKEAEFVKNAWKYAWEEIVKLAKDIWRDFLKVWFEPETERIFENIFHVLGDIGLIVGHLARNFRKAWNENENGYRILRAIRDIILIITEGMREAADYTVKWADKLNFIPLMNAIADVLEGQIVPAIQKIIDLLVTLYEDVFLELVRYIVEELGPIIVKIVGNIAEAIGNIAENFKKAWDECGRGKAIVKDIEDIITIIADVILDVSEKTKEWAKNINFRPALKAINSILKSLQPVVKFIAETIGKFWTDVLLPMTKDFVEKTLPKIATLLDDIVGTIDWNKLSSTVDAFFAMIKSFFDKYGEVMLSLISKIADKLIELVNSGTLEKIFNKVKDIIDKADPDRIADIVIKLGLGSLALKVLAAGIGSVLDKLIPMLSILNGIKQGITFFNVRKINKQMSGISNKITDLSSQLATLTGDVEGVEGAAVTAGGASLGTIALVIAAIALVTAAIITLWNTNDEFKAHITGLWEDFKKSVSDSMQGIVDAVNDLGFNFESVSEMIKTAWQGLCDFFAPVFEGAFKSITYALSGFVQQFSGIIEVIVGIINGVFHKDWSQLEKGIVDVFEGRVKMTKAGFETLYTSLKPVEEKAKGALKDANDSTKEWADSEDSLWGKMRDANVELNKMTENTDYANAKVEEWVNNEDSLWGKMRDVNTEVNTLSDNLGNSSGAIDAYASSMETTIPEANTVAIESMTELTNTAAETATQMETEGQNVASGFTKGIELGFDIGLPLILGPFGAIIKLVRDKFATHSPSKVFMDIGKDVIQGFVNGILALAQSPITAVTNVANSVINAARAALSPSKLISIGKNLLSGLANGIRSGISSAVGAIRSAAGSIIGAARSAFQVHSPSKIFEDIGEMLTEGLAVGVEKDTDDVENAFDDMVPDNAFLDMFYEKFIGMLSSLREESVNIVSSMIDEIEATIARMDNLAMLEDLSTKLSNISEIRVPDIATGTKLPENEKFAQQPVQQTDLSNLPAMLKSAFVEAFMESGALQNDDGDIIIQLNGNEIFREIRNENDKYRKQHGVSAFA